MWYVMLIQQQIDLKEKVISIQAILDFILYNFEKPNHNSIQ